MEVFLNKYPEKSRQTSHSWIDRKTKYLKMSFISWNCFIDWTHTHVKSQQDFCKPPFFQGCLKELHAFKLDMGTVVIYIHLSPEPCNKGTH